MPRSSAGIRSATLRGDGDREALAAAKVQVNRFGTPTAAELQSSSDMFFSTLALPSAQARRTKVRSIGYGLPSDFELNFGRYLPALATSRWAMKKIGIRRLEHFSRLRG